MKPATRENTAILMLACRDYEAMELALACHMRFGIDGVPFFLLQNCFGDYDAERTRQAARRYQGLYPERIRIIDWLGECSPYANIDQVLKMPELGAYDYILKVDDDAFPLMEGWFDALLNRWNLSEQEYGDQLAYVTPLINNNCWGFAQVIKLLGLEEDYRANAARKHRVGSGDQLNPFRTLPPEEIAVGANGSVWAAPDLARWLHERTTLNPQRYVDGCRGAPAALVPSSERYSIGAILFRRPLWAAIDDGGRDDEHMFHQYCARNDLRIVCEQSVPFVHIAYFSQRAENRDLVPRARAVYQKFTGLKFPIALMQDRLMEIEARLRWLETKSIKAAAPNVAERVGTERVRKKGTFYRRTRKVLRQALGLQT